MKMKKTGFTFIELIVAVTIFSIIAVSIYSVFRAGISIWRRTSPLIEASQSFRFFFDTITKDLKNSVPYVKKGVNFEGGNQKISFMAVVGMSGQDIPFHMELAKVIYYFDRAKGTVIRAVATRTEGFNEDHAKGMDILNGIEEKDFSFNYCYMITESPTEYDYEWKNNWEDEDRDNGRIPRGVRVKAGQYTKTIFVPVGFLGGAKNEAQ